MSFTSLPYIFIDLDQPGDKGAFRITVTDNTTRRKILQQRLPEKRSDFEYIYTARLIEGSGARPFTGVSDSDPHLQDRKADLVRYGRRLFTELFGTDGRLKTYLEKQPHLQDGANLVLRFHNTASELWNTPWEYMHDGDGFLALQPNYPIWRNVVDTKLQRSNLNIDQIPNPLKMLVVIAHPRDTPPLNVDGEIAMIRNAIEQAENARQIQISFIEDGTLENLEDALRRDEYHLLHYSGHGAVTPRGSCLIMENEHGMSRPVFLPELLPVIQQSHSLRFIFLNACKAGNITETVATSGIATGMLQVMPAVLAMQFSIYDDSASHFSKAFYGTLGKGGTLEEALYRGRHALYDYYPMLGDWGIPTLYTHVPHMRMLDTTTQTSAGNTTAVQSQPVTTASTFIGRREELRFIRQLLTDANISMLYVWGMAGNGKSALVRQALVRPGQQSNIEDTLTLQCDKLKLPELIRQLTNWIGKHFPESVPALRTISKDIHGAIEGAAQHVQGKQLILVFDQLDVLMHPIPSRHGKFSNALVGELFKALATANWSIFTVCTSRLRWDYLIDLESEQIKELHLSSLAPQDAAFIMHGFEQFKSISSDTLNTFFRSVGGHPQTLQYINDYLEKNKRYEVLSHPDFPKMLAKFWHKEFLGDVFGQLRPEEQNALRLLSVHQDVFNQYHVQVLMGIENIKEAEELMIGWETLSLANFIGSNDEEKWYRIPNLVATYVISQLQPQQKRQIHWRIADVIEEGFFKTAAHRFEEAGGPEPNPDHALLSIIEHLTWAFTHASSDLSAEHARFALRWHQHYREANRHAEASEVAIALLPLLHRFQATERFGELLDDLLKNSPAGTGSYLWAQYWQAIRLIDSKNPQEALTILRKLEAIAERGQTDDFKALYANTLEKQGEIYRNLGQDDLAMDKWREVLELLKGTKDIIQSARVMLSIAEIAYYAGAIPPATQHIEAGLQILTGKEATEDAIRILAKLFLYKGHLQRHQKKDFDALLHYTSAFRIGRQTGNLVVIALSLESLGYTYSLLHQDELAANLLLQALDIYEDIEDMTSLSIVLTKLALVQQSRKNISDAVAMCERALKLAYEHAPANVAQTEALLRALKKKARDF